MPEGIPELLVQLRKFPALKKLDLSSNSKLRLLPVGMLQFAAGLESFKCDGCSLLLPPQSMFSTPDENPRRIQQLLEGVASETEVSISNANLTSAVASDIAALLQHFRGMKQLNLSCNERLRGDDVCIIISSIAGAHCF